MDVRGKAKQTVSTHKETVVPKCARQHGKLKKTKLQWTLKVPD